MRRFTLSLLVLCFQHHASNTLQFEVELGNIIDETSDAIVNGVPANFDLNWGKKCHSTPNVFYLLMKTCFS